ncbi:DUF2267 domain-containing protein [Rubrobacter taiwanensis]|jgi:uncharacterized protein (DUF2267 family)|uniref:DUF2267 domain-containing protein n=1 Tax=Rubrobacter taiwanensis TaxID=185139 RepID=A0A4V2NXA9_9ACTN|nr:DUF2267 domain-containing protein [Rubrobacter taiwanensis]TCJ20542.1 DUF2267 domain-containing protein [Rubrobacter taiwanensis]
MQHDEFIERVRERAGLGTQAEAERATYAVLATLGDYLAGGEGKYLAAQLPQGVAEHLERRPPERSLLYSPDDFLQQVGEKEGASLEEARKHTRAVFSVLEEAVTEGEMRDIRRQFPAGFEPLFGS